MDSDVGKVDRKALERLARAATPGMWEPPMWADIPGKPMRCTEGIWVGGKFNDLLMLEGARLVCGVEVEKSSAHQAQAHADMAYIAAANPATVLALLREVEELERLRPLAEAGARLPVTADGVPIYPGMLVWENDGSNQLGDGDEPYEGFRVLTIGTEYQYERQRKQWVTLDGVGELTTDNLYSTRELAARAAQPGKEGGSNG